MSPVTTCPRCGEAWLQATPEVSCQPDNELSARFYRGVAPLETPRLYTRAEVLDLMERVREACAEECMPTCALRVRVIDVERLLEKP